MCLGWCGVGWDEAPPQFQLLMVVADRGWLVQTGAMRYYQTAAIVCAVLAVGFTGWTQVVLALLAVANLVMVGAQEVLARRPDVDPSPDSRSVAHLRR